MGGLEEQREAASKLSGGASSDVVYTPILDIIGSQALRGVVLDYGAGVGQLTSRLLSTEQFSRVEAADLMERSQSVHRDIVWHRQDLNRPLEVPNETYDLVVAAEIIEHLENPRATMRDWYRILRPGGQLIMSTPNNESFRAILHLIFRGHFVLFADSCYPAHITALTRKDVERIVKEAGFDCLQFRYSDVGGLPGQPNTTWQRLSFGALRGRRWSDNIIAVARRP